MVKLRPIMIVEDDLDDQETIKEIMEEIGVINELHFFGNTTDAYQHLKLTVEQPFIILSDINMPGQNGVELKRNIDEDAELRARSIPFVFLSTSAVRSTVDEAYKKMTVQGFFKKMPSYEEQKLVLKLILDYWSYCIHPNSEF